MKFKTSLLLLISFSILLGQPQAALVKNLLRTANPAGLSRPVVYQEDPLEPNARTIDVAVGGDFQAALDDAQPGDTIRLAAGATFRGSFRLPFKASTSTSYITIRPLTPDSSLPPVNTRVTPAYQSVMPKLVTPGPLPALYTEAKAHHYKLIGIEITRERPEDTDVDVLVNLGDGGSAQDTYDKVPHHLILDRCYIHGDTGSLHRAIGLHSAETSIINSYVSDIHHADYGDTQAIQGWNGPGPYHILNNYLEAAGENILFGGGDPSVCKTQPPSPAPPCEPLVPTNIEIKRNHLFKPPAWRGLWHVKNLLELKVGRDVRIDGNVLENSWRDPHGGNETQGGGAIVLTPRNQYGGAPWNVLEDIQLTNNIIRHAGGGIGILTSDDTNTTQKTKRITISNNLFEDINRLNYGTGPEAISGLWISLVAGHDPVGDTLTITHNTAITSDEGIFAHDNAQWSPLVIKDNILRYGFRAGGKVGNEALDEATPSANNWTWKNNVTVGNPFSGSYTSPAITFFESSYDTVGFTSANCPIGNYCLASGSAYKNAASDSTVTNPKDIGVDVTALHIATKGVVLGGSAQPAPTPLRINAGGPQYTDATGNIWQADAYLKYGGGYAPESLATTDILNTTDDALYRSERFGGVPYTPLAYEIPLANGSYTVRLHFAEIWWGVSDTSCGVAGAPSCAGKRVFNVSLEDAPVLTDYDVYVKAGNKALKAVVEQKQATITDGVLNIDFTAITDNAKISAIEVLPASTPDVVWTAFVNATANGSNLTKSSTSNGWNAGAISTQTVTDGNGYVEFSTDETDTSKMCGLNDVNAGASYTELDFAFYLRNDHQVLIYENGASTGVVYGDYDTDDRFRVELNNGAVTYYQNGSPLRTVALSAQQQQVASWFADTSLNTGTPKKAAITNATISSSPAPGNVSWTNVTGVSVSPSGATLTKTFATTGWDAGASSVQTLTGNGYVEFTAEDTASTIACGLNVGDPSRTLQDIDYAVFLNSSATSSLRIYEKGLLKLTVGTYMAGDKFRVEVAGQNVNYYRIRDGVAELLLTSAGPPSQVVVDTSLYSPGAKISNVVISGAWSN
ncbi:MAG: malectin [Pyrinomonadaceae bacterium]